MLAELAISTTAAGATSFRAAPIPIERRWNSSAPSLPLGFGGWSRTRNGSSFFGGELGEPLIYVDGQLIAFKRSVNKENTTPQELEHKAATAQSIGAIPQLDQIKSQLELSMTQLAELFGVTRKTVYDWYEGREPRPTMLTRIEILVDVLSHQSDNNDLRRLKALWNIPVSGKAFRAIFNDDALNETQLKSALIQKLNELSPRLAAPANFNKTKSITLGESHASEFDRRSDF